MKKMHSYLLTGVLAVSMMSASMSAFTNKALCTYAQETVVYNAQNQELVTQDSLSQSEFIYHLEVNKDYKEVTLTKYNIISYSNYKDNEIGKLNVIIPKSVNEKSEVTLSPVAIVAIVLGTIILLALGLWALLLFVLNKWIRIGSKAVRAFKLFGLKKKNGRSILITFPFKTVDREDEDIFETKEDALKN